VVRDYFTVQYPSFGERTLAEMRDAVLNKIEMVTAHPALRAVLCQATSTISLERIADQGRIFICNLNKAALGEATSRLLGGLITSAIAFAALGRLADAARPRTQIYFYSDEFASYATDAFGLILGEARKTGLALTLATQTLATLKDDRPQLLAAITGNVKNLVALRLGIDDAPRIAAQVGLGFPDPNPRALQELENFHAYAQILMEGMPSEPIALATPAPPAAVNRHPDRLRVNARVRFGRPRAAVEERLARFLESHRA
jgi:hypothetical protein